jgi:hypothetical protein
MDINKILEGSLDEIADNIFNETKNTTDKAKAIQKQRIGENVQYVIDALKKIEADLRGDLRDEYRDVANKLSERIISIKNGQDGRNGADGRAGKDGRAGRDGLAGAKGADGLPGRDGIDGVDGVSVTDASIDFDGSLIISLSNGRVINVGEVVSQDLADKIQVISTMSTNTAIAAITGGTIDGTAIGGTTPAAGAFTTVSATGVATFAAGTVALPSITTSGDTNTGVYFPAADTIAFTEGGAEAMRINSSGIVLIGTASATGSNLLQVNSDIRVNGLTLGKGASSISTNTGFGLSVLSAITTGAQNTAFGYAALTTDTTGFGNSAFGLGALLLNNGGSYNTALGHSALYYNTIGTQNTAVGHGCMGSGHTTGYFNTGVGYTALQYCTTGVATLGAITGGTGYTNGTYPGVVMTLSSGSAADTYPTATIVVAGGVVTTVTITSAGYRFVDTTTVLTAPAASIGGTGSGFSVLVATLIYGSANTGVGHQALLLTTVGGANTAIGYQTGRQNTTGNGNTSLGTSAGYAGVTASNNTSIGYNALQLATGGSNIGLGYNSGGAITTGTGNVVIGGYTGSTAPISTTGSNSIVISDGAGNVREYYDGTNNAWVFNTGASERMRIDSSGNVGIGATANASAILDAQSTTKGVRMPNMTTVQKNAIATPAAGLMVFDTTLAKLCVYTTAWETITSV